MKYSLLLSVLISLPSLLSAQQFLLDENYGENGIAVHDKYNGQTAEGNSILLEDGSLLLMGRNNTLGLRIQMLKILPDGTCDPAFGDEGIVEVFANVTYVDAALQSDGKIVGVGYRSQGGTRRASAFRLNADGSWDTSFGNNGSVVLEDASTRAVDVYIDATDQIYLADRNNLIRLSKDGALDTEFGEGGITSLPAGSIVSIDQRSDGAIIVAGQYLNTKIYYQEIGATGDTLAAKVVHNSVESTRDSVSFIKVLDDDAILIGGAMVANGIKQTALVKYSADDQLQFAEKLDLASDNWMTDLALNPDGSIVCIGNLNEEFEYRAIISHFDQDGSNAQTQELEDLVLRDIFRSEAISSCHVVSDRILVSGVYATGTLSVDYYTASIVNTDQVSAIFHNEAIDQFQLFPSPSDGSIGIDLNLSEPQSLTISIVDLTGRQMDALAENARFAAGDHALQYETDIPPGQYYLSILNSKGAQFTEQLIIVR